MDTAKYLNLLNRTFYKKMGKVSTVVGLTIESIGPDARLNDICHILLKDRPGEYISAEVVGFKDKKIILMPFENVDGVGPYRYFCRKRRGQKHAYGNVCPQYESRHKRDRAYRRARP